MGGYDLQVDIAALSTLAEDLKKVAAEFKDADNTSEDAAGATGHDGLRDDVQDFADSWRAKREDMLGDVTKLQGIVEQIASTFTQVDADLAKALEQKAGS